MDVSAMRLSILLVLGLLLVGCVATTPTPTPAPMTPAPTIAPTTVPPTPAPTEAPVVEAPKVVLSTMPTAAVAGEEITLKWRVTGGMPGKITHTDINWGKEPGRTIETDYPGPTNVSTGNTPQSFSAMIKVPTEPGTYYYRAHAVVDGKDVFSGEEKITIGEQPQIKLVSYPTDVLSDDVMIFKWEVTGGVPGNITHTAIHAGWNSGKAFTEYPLMSNVQVGQSPGTFTVTMTSPVNEGRDARQLYWRAHAIVDGVNIYSGEHTMWVEGSVGRSHS